MSGVMQGLVTDFGKSICFEYESIQKTISDFTSREWQVQFNPSDQFEGKYDIIGYYLILFDIILFYTPSYLIGITKNKESLMKCKEIYMDHKKFLENVENDLHISSSSIPSLSPLSSPLLGSCALDFDAIKETLLKSSNMNKVCSLLEALRWRISCAANVLEKRENCILLTSNDILEDEVSKSLLDIDNLGVVEHFLALVNALASDYEGRSYLIKKTLLIQKILELMFEEAQESFVRRISLFILQKLSLRISIQNYLIDNQMIQFAVKILLNEFPEMSDNK